MVFYMQRKQGIQDNREVVAGSDYSENRDERISSRLKVVRQDLGETQVDMNQLLGLGKNSWQRYEKGTNTPGSQVIASLVEKGYDANWILSGLGQMKRKAHSVAEPHANSARDEFVYIPKMVPVEISAGHGSEPATDIDMQYHAFRRDWLASRGLNARHLAIVTAKGDSMEPTIPNGSTLLVDTSVNEFSQDGIYVVRLDGHLFAKRLQRGESGSILVISDNALYDKITVRQGDGDTFSISGKVVWLGRDF